MRKIAVLIAVEQYGDARIPQVKYARADAVEFASSLQELGFKSDDQTLLIDTAATKTSIESRVRKVMARISESDILYFFYAGHGFARNATNHIACADTSLDDLEHTSIPVEWLFNEWKKSPCRQIVFFLDACESGMLAKAEPRGIFSDLTADELTDFFEAAEHCVCFAACKPGECSYPSDNLKHGIWAYHLIQAISANAPNALETGRIVTPSSLQNHLSLEVPRTLRATFTGLHVQTPMTYGSLNRGFPIADVTPILKKRKSAAKPGARQLRHVRLFRQLESPVSRLSGFQKAHSVPDNVCSATEAFVASIATQDVRDDLDRVQNALRSAFQFKRRDLETKQSSGSGSILTPYFDYEVTIALNPNNPSEALWRRQVLNIRNPEKILTEEFENAFGGMFDTLEFASAEEINIKALVDKIEDLGDDTIKVDYDMSLDWCTVDIDGFGSTIRVTTDAISIVHSNARLPKILIDSFFHAQERLVEKYEIKQLPFRGSDG